jgi:hypothetical protein
MTKRAILITLMTAALVSLIYILFFSKSAVAEVNEEIRMELPQGSTKQQIYDFLNSRKIPSAGYDAGPDPLAGLPDEDRQWRRYVIAWIPKRDYRIMIYFYFDENQNLDTFTLQRLDDAP